MQRAPVLPMLGVGREMTIGRHLRRICWLGGLVLVLALLAHDVLMASVAHAAPEAPGSTTAHGQISPHQAIGVDSGLPDHHPAPEHPSDCGATGTAVPYAGNTLDLSDLGLPAIFAYSDLAALVDASEQGWSEPFWPPGTRRALLQVYRI